MSLQRIVVSVAVLGGLVSGCMSKAAYTSFDLQRSLYPGLADLDATQIEAAFDKQLALRPPLSAGIVWLSGTRSDRGMALSEYGRTGVLEGAVDALRRPPFDEIGVLPTTVDFQRGGNAAPSIDAIRAAAARFQYDVAFIMQTGVTEESGFNPLAIGYLGIVTAPAFPGTDISVAAGAELCAVDVRSGIMLGCGIGRAYDEARFLFPMAISDRSAVLRERMVKDAIGQGAADVVEQIARRTRAS